LLLSWQQYPPKDLIMLKNRQSFYIVFPTPLGEAAIVYTDKPFLILKLFLPQRHRKDLVKTIEKDWQAKSGAHPNALKIAGIINKYFKGTAIKPPWEWMDMAGLTPLQQSVLRATTDIPYGSVRSYKQIAEAIHRPRAYRFVGSTLAKNPFPLLIPCHRVIRSDSSLGRFGGGTDLKRKIIDLEAQFASKKYQKCYSIPAMITYDVQLTSFKRCVGVEKKMPWPSASFSKLLGCAKSVLRL